MATCASTVRFSTSSYTTDTRRRSALSLLRNAFSSRVIARLPVAKGNETMGYIIRGDPNRDAVPSNDSDTMTSHFPTEFGTDLHIIIR
jgi:hypothetical protein